MDNMEGTTKTGFHYEVSEDRLNNYELLEAIAELEENTLILPKIVNLLLGKKQADALKDHVRTEEGFVPADKLEPEIEDILLNNKEIKN